MTDHVFPVPKEWAERAYVDAAKYEDMYRASVENPDAFWAEQGKRLDWFTPYTKIKDVSFNAADFRIRWFYDGVLNVAHNCLDRHLPAKKDQTAFIWEGDEPTNSKNVTYGELHEMVCRTANVMKVHGVKKGDRVTIYLPMIPEAAAAMLACARIGGADERRGPAVHPLHLRLHRQTQGRAAHHRRLPALGAMTHEAVFDYTRDDIYWCTADVGWVTGHSYIVYGPLANGATSSCSKACRTTRSASRFWQSSTSTRSTIFYTAPTAIRALMREGEGPVKKTSRMPPAPARQRRRADQPGGLAVVLPTWSATSAARSSTPGGRPKPAAS
jgi:hypothetical protein